MPAKKQDAAAQLAERLVQVLDAQRRLGPDSYPLTLRRLAELTDPAAPADQVVKALKKKPFADRAIAAHAKNLDAPVALAEDADRLAASPLLLEFVLDSACTPARPTCELAKLKTKVPIKLRPSFEAALQRHIAENTLPPTAAVLTLQSGKKSQTHLHLKRYP